MNRTKQFPTKVIFNRIYRILSLLLFTDILGNKFTRKLFSTLSDFCNYKIIKSYN